MSKKQHLFDNPRNVRLLVRGLVICCVILFGLDFVLHRHVEHPWESFPGFYAIYGFIACVILVLIARELRKLVMRDEDYYDREEGDQDND
jgi:hypothetical protein